MSVVFEETGEERKIVGLCKLCKPKGEPQLVSPTGIVHESSGEGITDCGHDATGDDWWWRI